MHARFEKIRRDERRSYHVAERRIPAFDAPWHFHPEFELTLILAGRGRRFVGNSLERFREGDLVLLGSNLPHFWQSDADTPPCHSIVVQFPRDFLGADFLHVPEMLAINRLLQRASLGMVFGDQPAPHRAREALRGLPSAGGVAGLTGLLTVLELLARDRQARTLTGPGTLVAVDPKAEARLARVFDFATKHFGEKVGLNDLAARAAMTPAAFSRFFKRTTGRAPSDFINDLRVEHSCRLLRETHRTVADIAGAAGFSTLTNYNRRFRERMSTTPREYRRSFQ